MSNFKRGDTVVNVSDEDPSIPIGFKAVVANIGQLADDTISFCDPDGDMRVRKMSGYALASEPTGPVRTETRKVIVPGMYGILYIADNHDIRMVTSKDPAELRAASVVLSQLADALESNK